ncbi:MAG TPA: aspartyl protease family protein [Chthoniobacterales bacterium]|jgi:predicted aspartyl protease
MKVLRAPLLCGLALFSLGFAAGEPKDAPKLPGYSVVALERGGMNRLALSARLEGEPILFLVDTGAALSAIDRASVKKFQLEPPPDRRIPRQRTLNGRKADVVWLRDFRIGEMKLGGLPMMVMPAGKHFADYKNGTLHGLLGADVLHLYQAVLDCGSGRIFFKTDPNVKVDLAGTLRAAGFRAVPLQQRHGHYYVECKLRKFPFSLLVDTGAFVTLLKRENIELFGVRSEETKLKQRSLNGTAAEVRLVPPEEHQLSIAGMPLRQPVGATHDPMLNRALGDGELGILGLDLLAANGAIIDFESLMLYLRPPRAERN